MRCEECRNALSATGRKLARTIEDAFPSCECESYSVGEGSPGRVLSNEILYRMFVNPVDVEIDNGIVRVARTAFSKAYEDGLSIIRDCAKDEDVEALATDILSRKPDQAPKSVLAIFKFICSAIRLETSTFDGKRAFCVYDQTTPRIYAPGPPVPTHGIVLSRRPAKLPIFQRQFENDCNVALHRVIAAERISVEQFRGGLIARLNERSAAGEFVRN